NIDIIPTDPYFDTTVNAGRPSEATLRGRRAAKRRVQRRAEQKTGKRKRSELDQRHGNGVDNDLCDDSDADVPFTPLPSKKLRRWLDEDNESVNEYDYADDASELSSENQGRTPETGDSGHCFSEDDD